MQGDMQDNMQVSAHGIFTTSNAGDYNTVNLFEHDGRAEHDH